MLAHVQIKKIDVGMYGEVYKVTIGDIENEKSPSFSFKITEWEYEQFKPMFKHIEKSGKFNEHEILN